ncbi:MAG: secreted protein [Amycolatopsis sp.]|uniref:HNH endonuclease family protein n=1 Tax=Amycolatopsis sp. TaxID=37632 RepID=UPI0026244183|nr:HNH endonuclease family protein [Amycolatopsis sp.]MCU1685788.1 secreted protein [Amycolatopsis sp.]
MSSTRLRTAAGLAAVAVLTSACHPAAAGTAPTASGPAAGSTAYSIPAAVTALAGLQVAPADTGAHYNRADWPHWSTVPGSPCDSREMTLKTQGTGVTTGAGCAITGGKWTSPYDGVSTTDARVLDIDHMVPLAEVARSGRIDGGRRVGPRDWTRAQRQHYANDPSVLVAVTLTSNRQKGDSDPAGWLPKHDRCDYVAHWVAVKAAYSLSVDQAEHDAIAAVLAHC